MRVGLHITPGLIRRRYDQGLDSIVRLVGDLEAQIEDLMSRHVSTPQKLIQSQSEQIKRLTRTYADDLKNNSIFLKTLPKSEISS